MLGKTYFEMTSSFKPVLFCTAEPYTMLPSSPPHPPSQFPYRCTMQKLTSQLSHKCTMQTLTPPSYPTSVPCKNRPLPVSPQVYHAKTAPCQFPYRCTMQKLPPASFPMGVPCKNCPLPVSPRVYHAKTECYGHSINIQVMFQCQAASQGCTTTLCPCTAPSASWWRKSAPSATATMTTFWPMPSYS